MLEKISLLKTKRDILLFLAALLFILFYSLLINYNNYKTLTHFDSCIINATVLKQYTKTKTTKQGKLKSYQILKLKAEDGFSFYTSKGMKFQEAVGKKLHLEIWTKDISFYDYLSNFYASSKIINIYKTPSLKEKLNQAIAKQHTDKDITQLYQALFSAKSLPNKLQTLFSTLGVSHLIAISGFHLSVLSALLFFFFKYPYRFLQNRYFPFRSYHRDSFVLLGLVLLSYLVFLDTPPSLLRAFSMFIVGFILYDRGVKILSMQTLLISVLSLLALFPSLIFSIGFWLSVSGVFYIFLFLIHFKNLNKIWQFLLLPLWVYLMMLPFSLHIFGNFSLYHPLSILWTSLFTLFYPLSIVLHLFDLGGLLDPLLHKFMSMDVKDTKVFIPLAYLIVQVVLSLLAIYKKVFLYLLLSLVVFLFVSAIYQVT
jgi:competence protein ComEC